MVSGAALFAQRLSEGLSNRGHHVLVLTASDQPEPYRTAKGSLAVERFRSMHQPLRVGQRFAGWPHRAIMRSLERFSPDIIHLHDPFQFALSALRYAAKKSLPVIFTTHQLPWFLSAYLPDIIGMKQAVERIMWSYSKWLLKQCTVVITPTRTVASLVKANTGINPTTISHGVDLDIYNNASIDSSSQKELFRRLGIPPKSPIILYVGRLDLDKQVNHVIEGAAHALIQKKAHLLIVGDGTQKNRLMEMCREVGIEQRSHFTGFIYEQSLLSAIYANASVFITASEIETQGLTLLEAAASGLPIVAYRATCIPEIVHQDVNGKLVQSGDKAALSDAILEILAHPERARTMGMAGREIAGQHSFRNTIIRHERLAMKAIEGFSSYPSAQLKALPDRVKQSDVSD
jgi:glycosyltransferase involved in cell wall biosynthesis